MKQLKVTQAKPNPSGNDRLGPIVPSSQLASEWVDFTNSGDENYPLETTKLYHIAYTEQYPNGVWEEVMRFNGTLGIGKIVRVHSGGTIPLENLYSVDRTGADYHLFTGKNYVWNNDRGDTPRLALIYSGKTYEIDKASYSPHPFEGKILKRNGERLI